MVPSMVLIDYQVKCACDISADSSRLTSLGLQPVRAVC